MKVLNEHKQIQPALAGECLQLNKRREKHVSVQAMTQESEAKQPTGEKRVSTQAIRWKKALINKHNRC